MFVLLLRQQYIVFDNYKQHTKCNFFYFFTLLLKMAHIRAIQTVTDLPIRTPKCVLYQRNYKNYLESDSQNIKNTKYSLRIDISIYM